MPQHIKLLKGAAWALALIVMTGCSSTRLKISGTTGAGFHGQYRVGDAVLEVSGAVPLVIEVPGKELRACEFRKTDAQSTMILEIRRGRSVIVLVTAEPGALGCRAIDDGGWHFEVMR